MKFTRFNRMPWPHLPAGVIAAPLGVGRGAARRELAAGRPVAQARAHRLRGPAVAVGSSGRLEMREAERRLGGVTG